MILLLCRSSNSLPPPSSSPILPKPPQGTRRRVNKIGSSSSQASTTSSFTTSFEMESTTTASTTTDTSTTTTVAATSTTASAPQINENLPVPTKRTRTSADAVTTQSSFENGSPVTTSLSFPLDKSADDSQPKKPVPVPRRSTLDRNLMSSSPLAVTAIRSPNTSTTSLPSIDVKEENTNLQARKESSSVLSLSSSNLPTVGSTGQRKESINSNTLIIPIALAIQETVNASFKGKTYGILYCNVKVLCYYF